MSYFYADDNNLDMNKWLYFLYNDILQYGANLILQSLVYTLLEQGFISEDIKKDPKIIFKMPIWSIYECQTCLARIVGIPKVTAGNHYLDGGAFCGPVEETTISLYWNTARQMSTDTGIYGIAVPSVCLPDIIPPRTLAQIVSAVMSNIDEIQEKVI